ncbi:MAG: serine/threonine protein kinase [Planctomycetes bacterium]|nr:serine/threonine protein kinase [Planctomycetota bacterium]
MNTVEQEVADTLVKTGRVSRQALDDCLCDKKDGEGLIDTLLRHDSLTARELEAVFPDPLPTDDPVLEEIKKLGRYVLLGLLGEGGMGRVFLAYDQKLKRSVGLKVMRGGLPEDLARFQRELEIAAALHHPHIATVYDAHVSNAVCSIAMEYIEGRPLDACSLSTREALEATAQAARAVHYAHQEGIIHRDLKPENLMRSPDGRVTVLDFGIARPIEKRARLTQSGVLVGTPCYMSPEQAAGEELDPRTDVYSLGATLYALLAHRPPFQGDSALHIMQKVAGEERESLRAFNPKIHRDACREAIDIDAQSAHAWYALAQWHAARLTVVQRYSRSTTMVRQLCDRALDIFARALDFRWDTPRESVLRSLRVEALFERYVRADGERQADDPDRRALAEEFQRLSALGSERAARLRARLNLRHIEAGEFLPEQ